MKILKLEKGMGDATVLLGLDDLEKLMQLCQIAAFEMAGLALPDHLHGRDDLRTLAETYAAAFEMASMLAAWDACKSLREYRTQTVQYEFPFTMEGQRMARSAKKVDDLLCDVDMSGLDEQTA